MAKQTLQVRKQELVRDAIYDAAIDLFAVKGFEETTVEEVAQAAGVSRRSFFRYYATKDDLLAQGVLKYGSALSAAIQACPASLSPFETMQATVLAGIKHTASAQALTRRIIQISERSAAARKAHDSRLMDVEDAVATAYAQRLKSKSKFEAKPRLLAHLTISVLNVAVVAWFTGEYQDLSTAATQVLASLTRIVIDPSSSTQSRNETKAGGKPAGLSISRRSGR